VIRVLRQHRPRLVLAPHWEERHYDHVHASCSVSRRTDKGFYVGLPPAPLKLLVWSIAEKGQPPAVPVK